LTRQSVKTKLVDRTDQKNNRFEQMEMILYVHHKTIRLEIGSELDLFFDYTAELDQNMFEVLKQQQSLNSDFDQFAVSL